MLSKAEKDYLIDLLEKGQSIPEDFKYKLFPVEHKEYELAYAAKMRKEDLLAADDGCIFVHLDWKKAHYIKVILDEIFGETNFVNEIVWHYPDNFQGNVNGFANNHNVIFWYSKSAHYTANKVLVPLAKKTMRDKRIWSTEEKKLVSARDGEGKLIYEEFTEKKADDQFMQCMDRRLK